ncbi:MAG: hypothetical protein PWP56_295 [Acetobacterium sp.]|jgi:hypothetical protein|uniref:hypothetical protein n=1 Tax=Acetobacterium sp. K1/6 TaxID=3055467 RepID=UPI0029E5BB59|nr:hypothetical protein [Acetobacterium sp. K1/6]MDK2940782.1 hypothetical protein [Acetobacterium sp.]MDZ5726550.1 hypothetical protein [Acetobacterium sp. K1/6]
MKLTLRIKNWIERFGVHAALSDEKGQITIIVSEKVSVDGSLVTIDLSENQRNQIEGVLSQNDYIALAPGQLGAIRAPYQLKGSAHLVNGYLEVEIFEIYCTKPGPEAGIRLDVLGYDGMKHFDESRWTDLAPANSN